MKYSNTTALLAGLLPRVCCRSLTNEQGMPIDPPGSSGGHPHPGESLHGGFNRFITFRNNVVRSNGGVVIRGTSANTLVTGSNISNSHVGVHVNYTTTDMFGAEVGRLDNV